MSKALYRDIDQKEDKRLDELEAKVFEGREFSDIDVFNSELIPNILAKSPRIIMDCIDQGNLPINCLLYPKVYGVFYKNCDSTLEPQLLKPFLEKGQLLPILQAPLSGYKTDFVELIVKYPYINAQELTFLRWAKDMDWDGKGGLCPDCFDHQVSKIMKEFRANNRGRKDYSTNRYLLKAAIADLNPTFEVEKSILDEIEVAVKHNRVDALQFLSFKSDAVSSLRNSEIFEAAPQTNYDDLGNIRNLAMKLNCKSYPILEERLNKEWLAKSLCIDYTGKITVDEYLDIIIPRKEKINKLLDDFLKTAKDQPFINIKDEIWRINSELPKSKTLESYTFAVNFAQNNWKVLFGMVIGALIGYSSGNLTACVGGGLGTTGAIADKIMQAKGVYKMPKYPKKTVEWIKSKIEDPQEKLLAVLLSKDVKTIQLWNLRRKLEK